MTTENKKKLFWIAGIALAVLYFGHSFIKFGPPLPQGAPANPAASTSANPAAESVVDFFVDAIGFGCRQCICITARIGSLGRGSY